MRVAMYYSNRDVRLEERPVPPVGPGELLVRVEASGICGSDVMEWYRLHRAPLVLGHEIGGVIARVGEGLVGFRVGDRVSATHHVPCHECEHCRRGHPTACDTLRSTSFDPGGFAEYLRVPAVNVAQGGVFPLPNEVSFEEATFIEPLACVMRGQRQARFQPGQGVLVIGSGVAGLLHVALARAQGAGPIVATDLSPYRLEAARRLGADAALPAGEDLPAALRRLNAGRLADLVVVCAGSPEAILQGMGALERGGVLLIFAPTRPGVTVALPVWERLWGNDVTITTSYAGSPDDCREALDHIRTRRVPVAGLVTHRLGLAETGLGFGLVAAAGESLKVIIEPQR
ncbi:MAG: alcohol dehydrogenase catalytic domain-containing protein [Chloroflexi bacterium]|nr:alcohol dehydrogenase catalytic domain-containing protein [Chloroflexota bacterium]